MVMLTPVSNPPVALSWEIKHSLIRYVLAMSDGAVEATDGAAQAGSGFTFLRDPHADAAAGALCFCGKVTLTGHSGMLRIVIADPHLEPGDAGGAAWSLTIADPYEPGARLPFAVIDSISEVGAAEGCRLTAEGADLFFSGPYTAGTELEPPTVLFDA